MAAANPITIPGPSWPQTPAPPGNLFEQELLAGDYYEVLRISPRAEEETIERVYRTLADRFHPENSATGDAGAYARVTEAYQTLSDPGRRMRYNDEREMNLKSPRFRLRAREFFDGVRGEQNRRLAVLCLLYRQRISAHEFPGRTILDLEHLTGCTREELASSLWYMCEKRWVKVGELTEYEITSDGFDVVETKLEERSEFRAFASPRYYNPRGDAEHALFEHPPV